MAEEPEATEGTEPAIKREHSLKPEVDDLTEYDAPNSQGRAGVAGTAKATPATPAPTPARSEPAADQSDVATYRGDYNDGSDFAPVDNDGETNS